MALSLFQKLLGRRSSSAAMAGQKSSALNFLNGGSFHSYVHTPGKPVWTPREYGKFSDEAYIRNVIAHRSISMIADGAASVDFLLYRRDNNGKTELKNHTLLSLLKRPNPCNGGANFFRGVFASRLISGNAYILALGDQTPHELHMLRADRMSIIAGKSCMPQGYRYTVGDNYTDYPVDRLTGRGKVLHLKHYHPLNDWYGLSPVEAAAYSIDQHNQAGQWNQALLQNGARPTGALVVKGERDGTANRLDEDQYNRLKAQLEDNYSGAANAGRPLLLEGGLEWKEMSLSPKDMDFIEAKHSSARDIALAFGVPPQLLGIPGDNRYSNFAEARLSLWEQTILPMLDETIDELNNWLVPMYGENLELSYDTDSISALAPRREKTWSMVKDADFLTEKEKREMLGF